MNVGLCGFDNYHFGTQCLHPYSVDGLDTMTMCSLLVVTSGRVLLTLLYP